MTVFPIIPHSRPWITESDCQAVTEVLQGGMIAQGQLVVEFESQVAQYIGCKHGVAQASGTSALILALKALKIGADDGIVLPTYVCRSVLEAVLSVGAEAQLCDVNEYGVLTEETVDRAFTERTRAIIAVHIFGHPCDVSKLRVFEVPVIEDACQAFGLKTAGAMAGTIGDVGIFSFHATKCITTGEGGILVTQDDQLASSVRNLALDKSFPTERHIAPMSDLQAALGLAQFSRFPHFIERRVQLLSSYSRAANKIGLPIGVPQTNLPFRFTLRTPHKFETIKEQFYNRRISVRKGVDELLHRLVGLSDKEFPTSVDVFNTTVSVPFYPSLSEEETSLIIDSFELLSTCQ